MNNKKYLFLAYSILLVISSSLFLRCGDGYIDCDTYDFSDCQEEEPYEAELIMKLSESPNYDSVHVVLYKGMIEDKDTIDYFVAEYDEYYIWLNIDVEYSAIATYYTGDQSINVVDGDKLRSSLTSRCEVACYIIKGDELDLTLEYNNIN